MEKIPIYIYRQVKHLTRNLSTAINDRESFVNKTVIDKVKFSPCGMYRTFSELPYLCQFDVNIDCKCGCADTKCGLECNEIVARYEGAACFGINRIEWTYNHLNYLIEEYPSWGCMITITIVPIEAEVIEQIHTAVGDDVFGIICEY